MNEWLFENGTRVTEENFDYDLHCFNVYSDNRLLGTIYPDSLDNMKSCIEQLNAGEDPISGMWEDGNGNSCTLNGW